MFENPLHTWLTALADPEGLSQSRALPSRPLEARNVGGLLPLAEAHGVLPAVMANLRQVAERSGLDHLVAGPSAGSQLQVALEAGREKLVKHAAVSLLIRSQLSQIAEALARRGVTATVLKGTEFADRLYPRSELRVFTDIDLLVPMNALRPAEGAMRSLGYHVKPAEMKYAGGYGEQIFCRDGPGANVEIHWNLVNSPSLRAGVSVAFGDLQYQAADGGGPPLDALRPGSSGGSYLRPSSASLLLTAAVHAAASHCFDRLILLCDICQAARGAAGEIDTDWLASTARRTGSSFALTVGLDLAERLLAEPRCSLLRQRLGLGGGLSVWRALLTRGTVLRAHAAGDSFRRNIFRQMLKRRR